VEFFALLSETFSSWFFFLEAELSTTCVIRMEGDQTIINHPNESEGYGKVFNDLF
jgi:hypothetical protein